ncbi:hypothetical protein EDC04DRAFT_2614423 [Pisolithus marmoratus]|nr:hypothetical protein EDC04DRAFT_2614423 [Pisolithus marmoratus]
MLLDINGHANSSITHGNEKGLDFLMEGAVNASGVQSRLWYHPCMCLGYTILMQRVSLVLASGICGSGIIDKQRRPLQPKAQTNVTVQTKATPCHSEKATENIILQIMATQKSLENYETRLGELEKDLLNGASDMTSLNIQLAECHQRVRCFRQALQKQKATLGVNGLADLATLQSNSYLQMAALIHQGKAPQGSIAPVLVPRDALFKLYVDDDIWQDAGLGDDTVRLPLAWLADENVQSGIRSLLELRHCEEERHLLHERRTLMVWFSEEWSHMKRARGGSGDDLAYELYCHASALASLCLLWQKQLRGFPSLPDESWGANNEELNRKVLASHLLATDGDEEESLDDLKFEDEEEPEMLDDELLCVAEEFALADEYHQQFSDMPSTDVVWADEWEFDVLDMDPQSSPSKRHCR